MITASRNAQSPSFRLDFGLTPVGPPRTALTVAASLRCRFLAMKPSLRFGQVPCLQLGGGDELFQSSSVLRFVARKFDTSGTLYPSDPAAAAQVDALVDQVKDMMQVGSTYLLPASWRLLGWRLLGRLTD